MGNFNLINKHRYWLLLLIVIFPTSVIGEGIPEMTGTDHVIQRDIFSSSGMVEKSSTTYRVHDALGQSSPVFMPDSSIGADNFVLVGFLPPDDDTPPVSWIWTDYEYTPDTMVVLHWAGHDSTGGQEGSGISYFDVQYRQDGGAWIDWISTVDTTDVFGPCDMGSIYDFRIRAVDYANNVEKWTTNPDSFATTTIDYLVELEIQIAPGGLALDSANCIRYAYYNTLPAIISTDSTWDSADIWCIPGSDIEFNELSSSSNGEERWITIDDTLWTILSRTDLPVTYHHQLWSHITLIGTDPTYSATLEHHDQFGLTASGSTHFNIFEEWVDRQGTLRFSEFTTGTPPRQTYDPREWTLIISPINDTIWYGYAPVLVKNSFGTTDTGVVIVDGDTVPSPYQNHWIEGSLHTLCAVSPQFQTEDKRYIFESWSDGGAQFHTIEHSAEVDSYIAYFTIEYPLKIFKFPEEPYGWIAFEDDTAWGTSEYTYWAQPGGPYQIAVSDTDIYSDSIWTFDHWSDFVFTSNRTINLYSARDLIAVYNVDTWEGELSFSISDSTWFAGNVDYYETRCMNDYQGIYLENTGTVALDWGLWIREDGPRWTANFTPGIDAYTLRARFTNTYYAPECIEYDPVYDWVDYNLTWATDEIFGPTGWGVPSSGMNWAQLWLYFKAPSYSTYGTVDEVIEMGILGRIAMP